MPLGEAKKKKNQSRTPGPVEEFQSYLLHICMGFRLPLASLSMATIFLLFECTSAPCFGSLHLLFSLSRLFSSQILDIHMSSIQKGLPGPPSLNLPPTANSSSTLPRDSCIALSTRRNYLGCLLDDLLTVYHHPL